MSLYEFEGKRPAIGMGTYIFETADVIGDVELGEGCYIGSGARLRGDYGSIKIGNNTAVEENVVIHARPGDITRIGSNVTVGHSAVIHNATIHDWAIIGMNATVSDWAVIGVWAVVAEGAVVTNGQSIPDRAIAVGIPAKVISHIDPGYEQRWTDFKKIYTDLAIRRYPNTLKKIA